MNINIRISLILICKIFLLNITCADRKAIKIKAGNIEIMVNLNKEDNKFEKAIIKKIMETMIQNKLSSCTTSCTDSNATPIYTTPVKLEDLKKILKLEIFNDQFKKMSNNRGKKRTLKRLYDDLQLAAASGDLIMVERLTENCGLDVNHTDIYGNTPLHSAIKNSQVAVVELLIKKYNANVNIANKYNITPLHLIACGKLNNAKFSEKESKTKIIQMALLIIPQANLEAKTGKMGFTPLHVAGAHGNLDLVKLLIKYNANFYALTKDNKTVLDVAIENEQTEVVNYFLQLIKLDKSIPGMPEDLVKIVTNYLY